LINLYEIDIKIHDPHAYFIIRVKKIVKYVAIISYAAKLCTHPVEKEMSCLTQNIFGSTPVTPQK
jgi:hypothetical protein